MAETGGLARKPADLNIRTLPVEWIGSPDYARLFTRSAATAFQHPLWLETFYRTLAPARDAEPVLVAGHAGPDPVFVLPMTRRRMKGITLLEAADLGVCDYCAPVVDPDWAGRLGELPGLRAGVSDACGSHDVLRIRNIRPEHLALWQSVFDAPAMRQDFSAHETVLRPDHAEWSRDAYSASFAKYLKRRKNRFFKFDGARLVRITDADAAAREIDALAALRDGRFEGDMIAMEAVRHFYAMIARDGTETGYAAVYRLELEGNAIGHVFGVDHAGRFHYLLIGCDYETHGRHSPGLLMYDAIIAERCAEGGQVFDFTIGDEPFKADFGTCAVPIHAMEEAQTLRGRMALAWQKLRRGNGKGEAGASIEDKAEEK